MKHKLFYANLTNYGVSSVKELNSVYICRICKTSMNRTLKVPIYRFPKYTKILTALRELTKDFYSRNPNDPMVLNNFKQNIEALFNKENIGLNNYKVLIANNVITGFKVVNIPIVDSIIFPLKEGKYE